MSREYWVHRTISLSQSNGIVHIEAEICDWEDGNGKIYLEWNARELLDDIPSLYEFAIKAEKGALEHRQKKYIEFKKKIK
jgi:hypothetical protein|tara:strand:+ start:5887 stop:6126 length:240 start_codon:yes stop_codon:yes gene_type:complete